MQAIGDVPTGANDKPAGKGGDREGDGDGDGEIGIAQGKLPFAMTRARVTGLGGDPRKGKL